MKTQERVEKLSDAEALALYERVSRVMAGAVDLDAIEKQASNTFGISVESMQKVDIPADQAMPIVRESLSMWATNKELSLLVDNFLDKPIKVQGVGIIFSLGTVLITTLATSSIKLKYKDGKWEFSFDSENISDNAVKIVEKVLSVLPKNLKSLIGMK